MAYPETLNYSSALGEWKGVEPPVTYQLPNGESYPQLYELSVEGYPDWSLRITVWSPDETNLTALQVIWHGSDSSQYLVEGRVFDNLDMALDGAEEFWRTLDVPKPR